MANEYKTLLQINYPSWLTSDGSVKLETKRDSTWLNKITFGKLGRSSVNDESVATGNYNGATKTQIIRNASQLRLPSADADSAGAPPSNGAPGRGTNGNMQNGQPPRGNTLSNLDTTIIP